MSCVSTIRGTIQYLLWALGDCLRCCSRRLWWMVAPSCLIKCLLEEEVLDRNATIRDGFPLIRKISGLVLVSFYFAS